MFPCLNEKDARAKESILCCEKSIQEDVEVWEREDAHVKHKDGEMEVYEDL